MPSQSAKLNKIHGIALTMSDNSTRMKIWDYTKDVLFSEGVTDVADSSGFPSQRIRDDYQAIRTAGRTRRIEFGAVFQYDFSTFGCISDWECIVEDKIVNMHRRSLLIFGSLQKRHRFTKRKVIIKSNSKINLDWLEFSLLFGFGLIWLWFG